MTSNPSRYDTSDPAFYRAPGGGRIAYLRRRFLPQGTGLGLLTEAVVTPGDRLDLIAGRTLGSPLLYWMVCDANDGMNPFELTTRPGRRLRVPTPFFEEQP